jgi:hypothetical protein
MSKRPDSGGNWTAYLGALTTVNTTTKAITVTGLTSFSEFTITDQNSPLPVEWLDVTAVAQDDDVRLDWSTAMEINNSYFDVERSEDGTRFEKVGERVAKGNSMTPQSYAFTDGAAAKLPINVIYYRIKQVDNNGTFSYSKMVPVILGDAKDGNRVEAIYPNPFTDQLNVLITGKLAESASLTFTDQFGRIIGNQKIAASAGTHSYLVKQPEHMAAGVYFVEVRTGDKVQQFKVVKY